jgi:hypothetical protein
MLLHKTETRNCFIRQTVDALLLSHTGELKNLIAFWRRRLYYWSKIDAIIISACSESSAQEEQSDDPPDNPICDGHRIAVIRTANYQSKMH